VWEYVEALLCRGYGKMIDSLNEALLDDSNSSEREDVEATHRCKSRVKVEKLKLKLIF